MGLEPEHPLCLAVVETGLALSQKVITCLEGDRPEAAREYAAALQDTTQALQNLFSD